MFSLNLLNELDKKLDETHQLSNDEKNTFTQIFLKDIEYGYHVLKGIYEKFNTNYWNHWTSRFSTG